MKGDISRMKLSTRGQYSARAMLDIAINSEGGKPVQLRDIARRQDIPEKYLERLIGSLRAAGLLKSLRGAQGGYLLSRPPAEIRLSEIIQIVEGPISPVECVDSPNICQRSHDCVAREIWDGLKQAVYDALSAITLEKMTAMQKAKLEHGCKG